MPDPSTLTTGRSKRWIGDKPKVERHMENNSYWPGQQIYIGKAEIEDGDSHQNPYDMDWSKHEN